MKDENVVTFLAEEMWYRSTSSASLEDVERECRAWCEVHAEEYVFSDTFREDEMDAMVSAFRKDVDPEGKRFLPHRPFLYGPTG